MGGPYTFSQTGVGSVVGDIKVIVDSGANGILLNFAAFTSNPWTANAVINSISIS
jgi:hypothetical protein